MMEWKRKKYPPPKLNWKIEMRKNITRKISSGSHTIRERIFFLCSLLDFIFAFNIIIFLSIPFQRTHIQFSGQEKLEWAMKIARKPFFFLLLLASRTFFCSCRLFSRRYELLIFFFSSTRRSLWMATVVVSGGSIRPCCIFKFPIFNIFLFTILIIHINYDFFHSSLWVWVFVCVACPRFYFFRSCSSIVMIEEHSKPSFHCHFVEFLFVFFASFHFFVFCHYGKFFSFISTKPARYYRSIKKCSGHHKSTRQKNPPLNTIACFTNSQMLAILDVWVLSAMLSVFMCINEILTISPSNFNFHFVLYRFQTALRRYFSLRKLFASLYIKFHFNKRSNFFFRFFFTVHIYFVFNFFVSLAYKILFISV